MSITHWPLQLRPREKLISNGAEQLSTPELLAIFLRTGVPGKNAVELAYELLNKYPSLQTLSSAPLAELAEIHGLGLAKCAMLKAALELGRRYFTEKLPPGDCLGNPQQTKNYIAHRLSHYSREVFACLLLNAQNHIIDCKEVFFGTLTEVAVYPREIIKYALDFNAAKIILAHNHPSGHSQPSPEDCQLTKTLQEALELVGVQVIDHLIIGQNEVLSFAELGLL